MLSPAHNLLQPAAFLIGQPPCPYRLGHPLYSLAIPVVVYSLILMTGEIVLPTLFFAGYAIDSILEFALTRFDTTAAQQSGLVLTALRERLRPAEKPGRGPA